MYGCPWINYFFFPPYEWSHFCLPPQERYCFRVGLTTSMFVSVSFCVCAFITCRIKNSTSMLIGSVCLSVCLFVCLSVSTLAVTVPNQLSSSYYVIIVWASKDDTALFWLHKVKGQTQRSLKRPKRHFWPYLMKYRSDLETVKCVG